MAAPHNDEMNMGFSWEGAEARRRRASTPKPSPPPGRGMGKPGFPMSQPRLGAAGVPTGGGAVRQAHRRWRNPVSPYVHIRPHARGAQRQHATVGGLTPSLTLPRWGREPGSSPQGGGWRNPVSPCPNRPWGRLAPLQAGVRFDRLTAGGEPRFPHSPTAVGSGWRPYRQGRGSTSSPQVGKPGFPVCSHQEGLRYAQGLP